MKFMTTAAVIGIAGLGIIAAAPVASADPTPTTTVTCGGYGLQAGLSTKVCAEVTGDNVRLFGQVGLAGPPSPGSPPRQPQSLNLRLSGNVSGVSLGAVNQSALFLYTTINVSGVGGTVACGSTVHGSFAVDSYPWPSQPVTLDLVLPC